MRVLAVAADVSTAGGRRRPSSRRAIERFGRLDILVNNVGKAGGGDIVSTPDEEWQSAHRSDAVSRRSACRGSSCRTCGAAAAA